MRQRVSTRRIISGAVAAVVALLVLAGCGGGERQPARSASAHQRVSKIVERDVLLARATQKSGSRNGLEAPAVSAADEQVAERAQPKAYVNDALVLQERSKALGLPTSLGKSDFHGQGPRGHEPYRLKSSWQPLGPVVGNVAPFWSTYLAYSGRQQTASGRATAMAISPRCGHGSDGCEAWVGAAGGGIWRTADALASTPSWTSVSEGLPSNAIGSLIIDPTDPSGQTLYAGTGEGNESSDSEAGLGLYKSTDGGDRWSLVRGSYAVAHDRSIDAIAIDPTDPRHIYLGTSVGRHQSSANRGGPSTTTPPGAPTLGLYESTDGGKSFSLTFSKPADTTPPISGRGGINQITLDPKDPKTAYVGMFSYGIWRRSARLDGDQNFHQVFADTGIPPSDPNVLYDDRTSFALTVVRRHTRAYAGDGWSNYGIGGDASFFRVDNADVPAASLTDGSAGNPGWTKLSSSTNGDPGFAVSDYCGDQCDYDNVVAVDPKNPNTVWIGGQTAYNELSPFVPGGFRSNGRAVMRSTDAGVHWTDMTADTQRPQFDLHPDQHSIAFDPANPDIAFIGNDGGVYRTDGQYSDASSTCNSRPFGAVLTGADLADCQSWLSAIPHELISLNAGLNDLQFQSLSFNPASPTTDLLGGTQDNGTWHYTGSSTWTEVIGGDGGSSGFDAVNPNISYSSFTYGSTSANFQANDPNQWDEVDFPLFDSGEQSGFYKPLVADPVTGGTVFVGMQHVWRSTDHGGSQSQLDQHCSYASGDFSITCGDFQGLGPDLTAGSDKTGYHDLVATIARTTADTSTLWAATRYGRIYVSHNADASDPTTVTFSRIDSSSTPNRYPTGIVVDPENPNHAWISFTGYDANTPGTPGHVFDVRFDASRGKATWTDISKNLGDQPVTNLAYDVRTGDLYAATDFVVLRLPADAGKWEVAARGLPLAATYGLAIASDGRRLYAATHGRGVWSVKLPAPDK